MDEALETGVFRGRTGLQNVGPLPRRRALIIANKTYQSPHFHDLPNSIRDGHKLQEALLHFKWNVQIEENQNREEMHKVISQFVNVRLNPMEDDALLFAFIGHGIEVNGSNYLVPSRGQFFLDRHENEDRFETDIKDSCIQLQDVVGKYFESCKGVHPTIFIMDCCRTGFDTASDGQGAQHIATLKHKSRERNPKSRERNRAYLENSCFFFSTGAGQVAQDGKVGQGGPFMKAFVDEMIKQQELLTTLQRTKDRLENCQDAHYINHMATEFFFQLTLPQAASNATNAASKVTPPQKKLPPGSGPHPPHSDNVTPLSTLPPAKPPPPLPPARTREGGPSSGPGDRVVVATVACKGICSHCNQP
eukprot:1994638-Rhodomonas_salina.1